jgi:hypothetical protein
MPLPWGPPIRQARLVVPVFMTVFVSQLSRPGSNYLFQSFHDTPDILQRLALTERFPAKGCHWHLLIAGIATITLSRKFVCFSMIRESISRDSVLFRKYLE